MTALTRIASGLLGRGRGGAVGARPARRPAGGVGGMRGAGTAGTDAAIGRGVRSLLRRRR
ncbi:hypothetical protein [Nocardioides perillae]|uniref:Uncharacterized protein n=1 Tax=Nocardioides perillae TaxID=1119534 RepID=A0A7Y9UKD8_9ACTN|nr:hypothetical protein [Nocardioides perillae]NYG53847.1 hypothetical protein [Nocardioides perillae]